MKSLVLAAVAATLTFNLFAVTEEEYEAAKQTIKAYTHEHKPKQLKPEVKKEVDKQRAALGVDAKKLDSMYYRAQIIEATRKKQGEKSELIGRKAKASMRERIEQAKNEVKVQAERAEANEAEAKKMRELAKAAKKSAKNLDKILKNIEKAKKQSSDEEELAFYETLETIIREGNEGGAK